MTNLSTFTDNELFDEIEAAMASQSSDAANNKIADYASRVMAEMERRGLMPEPGDREEVA